MKYKRTQQDKEQNRKRKLQIITHKKTSIKIALKPVLCIIYINVCANQWCYKNQFELYFPLKGTVFIRRKSTVMQIKWERISIEKYGQEKTFGIP
jgi:hypothetical protein